MKKTIAQKCDHCENPAVAIDYVDGVAHAWCEACKAPRSSERYLHNGKVMLASYVGEHSEVDGERRLIGWALIAGPLRGRGKTQAEALADFKDALGRATLCACGEQAYMEPGLGGGSLALRRNGLAVCRRCFEAPAR